MPVPLFVVGMMGVSVCRERVVCEFRQHFYIYSGIVDRTGVLADPASLAGQHLFGFPTFLVPGAVGEMGTLGGGLNIYSGIGMTNVKRGFVLLPRRWAVERDFGWMSRFRQLARDQERLTEVVKGFHLVAFTMLMWKQALPVLSVL